MHYGKTLIVTLIAALTLLAGPKAHSQMILMQQPPPSGPSWSTILGGLGAIGGAVAGYNANGTSFTGSQGWNTAAGAGIGLVTGAVIGSLIDNSQASVIGFGKSIDDLECVHINQSKPARINGTVLPPGNYCYCFYKSEVKAQAAKSKSRSSKTNLTDSEEIAIKNTLASTKCNHDRVEYYDAIKRMRFAYENEHCQTYGDDNSGATEAEAINMCLAESSTCNKLK